MLTFLKVARKNFENKIDKKTKGGIKMHPKMKHVYVGVDTHKRTHTAVIINCCKLYNEINQKL